ncbi:unnamed protein product [Arabidopsis halleri]
MHMIKPPEQRHSRRRHRLLRSLGHQLEKINIPFVSLYLRHLLVSLPFVKS